MKIRRVASPASQPPKKDAIAENITPVTEAGTDEQPGFTGYEYDLTQYTKDEYIKMIDDRNASLEDQMTQAQEAMCEIYEMMA